jgi:Tol biopolymer transport system component/C-terminal processing protease CtpA/Prc
MKSVWLGGLSALVLASGAMAQDGDNHWLRQPAVSPDGQTILFTAYGDLWRVSASGGQATLLTLDDAWDGYPVWSRDGRHIAFASDRFGDLDIFVMNADGSDLSRLTFHSADDVPSDFAPDGSGVLFSSSRGDNATSAYFPTGALPELYEVATAGGTPRRVMTSPGVQARYSPDGTRIAYREEKAYENDFRQRDVSSFARDIWIFDIASGAHEQITTNAGGDHAPAWDGDDALFMLSEVEGDTFNAYRFDLGSGERERLSSHGPHPARELSASADGLVVYSYHGNLYSVRAGEAPQRLDISFPTSRLMNAPEPISISGRIGEFDISPDGKEIAFVSRGEVFVTSVDFSDTVRITDTPEQERSVSFSPDGRSLIYAGNRGGAWTLFETTLTDDTEPRFSAATGWEEREVFRPEDGGEAFQPAYSPDGEMIAFIENRDAISVINRDGGDKRTIFGADLNYSYSDGDISFSWSPDSRWIAADYVDGFIFYGEIGVAPADGSAEPVNISMSGYADQGPIWHPSGEALYWFTDRYGERTHGSWGSELDVIAGFLTQTGWDRFNLTEFERSLLEEGRDEDEESEDEAPAQGGILLDFFAWFEELTTPPMELELEAVERRTRRLTIHSSNLADAVWSEDGSKLYYLSAFEGGFDLWVHDLHEGETKRLAQLGARGGADIELIDESTAVVLADGSLRKINLSNGSPTGISTAGEMNLRADAERGYFFDHVWRQVNDKFYDPDFHGVDWDAMRTAYEPLVAATANNRDFALLMSEMLGQLNASHTGMYYNAGGNFEDDSTAALGAIFDLETGEPGLTLAEILPGGPLDRGGLNIEPGSRITGIGGVALTEGVNPFEHLNRVAGERVRLSIQGPGGGRERDVIVRTWSQGAENQALYERWIERRRAIVDEASDGRVGYVHIRSMNDGGFRAFYSELMGRNFSKEAVVVDTRFNGGGWLHDDLLVMLTGESYFNLRARDRILPGAPEERWTKPSIVVMNEGNYSNAHMFPWAYSHFDVGQLVGMPVPGTGTAVWWETLMSGDLRFGIPQLPVLDENDVPVENQTLMPDIMVDNPPQAAAAGEDQPLVRAVEALLTELDG